MIRIGQLLKGGASLGVAEVPWFCTGLARNVLLARFLPDIVRTARTERRGRRPMPSDSLSQETPAP